MGVESAIKARGHHHQTYLHPAPQHPCAFVPILQLNLTALQHLRASVPILQYHR
jgi:hypothetical protein